MNKNQFHLIVKSLLDLQEMKDHPEEIRFIQGILITNDRNVASKALMILEDFLQIKIQQVGWNKYFLPELKQLVENEAFKSALEKDSHGSELLQKAMDLIRNAEKEKQTNDS